MSSLISPGITSLHASSSPDKLHLPIPLPSTPLSPFSISVLEIMKMPANAATAGTSLANLSLQHLIQKW